MTTFYGFPVGDDPTGYSLETARSQLKWGLPWIISTVSLEPLDGLADGVNTIFHAPVVPMDSSEGVVLENAAGAVLDGWTVADYEHGAIRFASGSIPNMMVYASYTAQAIPDTKLLNICMAGFDEMESRYRRNWYVVLSGGKHYVSTGSNSVNDPQCGSTKFSMSRTQIDLLLNCAEYKLLRALATDTAMKAFAYREERVGGLMIDRSRQATAFDKLIAELDQEIDQKVVAAMDEEGNMGDLGGFVPGAQSNTYRDNYEWWSDSSQASGGS